jgi:DNA mismatch repair protein MSH5
MNSYVAQMQSAFMIDLNQVSLALRNTSTPRSLLVLDEFGKGTLAAG